jgi:hypothetical protein
VTALAAAMAELGNAIEDARLVAKLRPHVPCEDCGFRSCAGDCTEPAPTVRAPIDVNEDDVERRADRAFDRDYGGDSW